MAVVAIGVTVIMLVALVPIILRSPIGNELPEERFDKSYLRFSAGDIISCNIHRLASHIFLAASNSSVFHAPGVEDDRPDETRIKEVSFHQASSHYTKCEVITEFYDNKYANRCGGSPLSTQEIIRRADESVRKFRGRYAHYNKFKCNCEHWVSAWRYGTSWTLQAGAIVFRSKYRSDHCEAPGLQDCTAHG